MSTSFKPLMIPPGVKAMPTKKVDSSNYSEVNMVRWVEGQLAPIGGQTRYNFTFASKCKAVHGWFDLSQVFNVAYLCEANLYVDRGGVLLDITPTGGIRPPTPPTTGGYGDGPYSQNVVLKSTAAWTTSSPNITMVVNPGSVQVGMAIYNETQSLYVGVVQTFTGTALVLTTNAQSAGAAGDSLNFDWYGGPRAISADAAIDRVPDAYSLNNFGAILLAMTSADGRLLQWNPAVSPAGVVTQLAAASAILTTSPNITMPTNPGSVVTPGLSVYNVTKNLPVGTVLTYIGTALVLTANALNAGVISDVLQFSGNLAAPVTPLAGSTVPLGRCFVVTSERFVQIFGAYNDGTAGANLGGSFRRFAWCEQEDFTNWSYSDLTTQAGFIDIEPASPIITAVATRTGTLFWTAKKTYRSRFLGAPYIYQYDELGDATTPWSPQSMVTTSSMVLWMSQQGPYSYDGTSILPVQCMVRAWIDDDIDLLQVRAEACAIHVANFNEFWWCYPQAGMSGNTRVAIYNYKEGWWAQCRCARSAGVTASYTNHTIMANDRVAYEHESGFAYYDCDLPWIETFDLNVGGGKLITVKQMLPDIEGAITGVLYSLFYRNSRTLGLVEQQTAVRPVRQNGYVDFRTTGRDMRLRIDLAAPAGFIIDQINNVQADGNVRPVTVGQHLIDFVPRGDR